MLVSVFLETNAYIDTAQPTEQGTQTRIHQEQKNRAEWLSTQSPYFTTLEVARPIV